MLLSREIHKYVKGKDSYDVIQCQEFCSFHGLKQLIKSWTRITEHKCLQWQQNVYLKYQV